MKYQSIVLCLLMVGNMMAQKTADQRPEESTILIEKLFVDATKEKILQNYDEAIEKYLGVLQEDPNNAVACYELSKLYDQQKQLDKAILKAEQATLLSPDTKLFAEQYARVLDKTGDNKKTAELYAKLVKQYPKETAFYHKWAYYLSKDDKQDQAIKVYQSLEKEIGVSEVVSMRKYQLYMGLGKNKKAKQELEKLLDSDANNGAYRLNLANYYASEGDFEQSNEWYKKTLEVDPTNPEANVALVKYFLQNGDTLRYLEALVPIFADHQQSVSAKISTLEPLAVGLIEGRYKAYSKQIYQLGENMSATHPEDMTANLIQGELLYNNKKYNKALPYFEKALTKDNNNNLLWQRLLACYEAEKKYQLLGEKSNEMLELFPSQPYGYYYSGVAQLQQNKYKDATENLEYAAEIAVTDIQIQAQAQAYLGQAYTYLKSYAKAKEAFERALELVPNNNAVLEVYANSLAVQGVDLDKAMKMTEEGLLQFPNNPVYHTTKGIVLYKRGQYQQAAQILNKAYNLGGSQLPQTLEYAGDAAFRLEQVDQAVEYWQQALDNGGNSAILKRKIETRQLYE